MNTTMPTRTQAALRYDVRQAIGRGGTGIVFRVIHNECGQSFAMKVLKSRLRDSDPHSVSRFLREARAMAKIRHPGVIQLVDTGQLPDGCPYLIMRLLEGATLADLAAGGALPIAPAVRLTREIAVALGAVHAAGVVHRDLSPGNVFMSRHAAAYRPIIIDFGSAWVGDADMIGVPDSPPGILVGTPHYMSPEQIAEAPLDHRTDIYSLGAILFELLDGCPPFDDYSARQILRDHLCAEPPPLDSPYGEVPSELERIVLRCLEKAPADRFQSAAELVAELDHVLAQLPANDERALVQPHHLGGHHESWNHRITV